MEENVLDTNMNLYDLNKLIISQIPSLSQDALLEKKDVINALHAKYNNSYYMLYGKEISYFTLFKIIDPAYFNYDVFDCLKHLGGDIKAMDLTEDSDAVEIWIEIEQNPTCLYLFPYDSGVVNVGGDDYNYEAFMQS